MPNIIHSASPSNTRGTGSLLGFLKSSTFVYYKLSDTWMSAREIPLLAWGVFSSEWKYISVFVAVMMKLLRKLFESEIHLDGWNERVYDQVPGAPALAHGSIFKFIFKFLDGWHGFFWCRHEHACAHTSRKCERGSPPRQPGGFLNEQRAWDSHLSLESSRTKPHRPSALRAPSLPRSWCGFCV